MLFHYFALGADVAPPNTKLHCNNETSSHQFLAVTEYTTKFQGRKKNKEKKEKGRNGRNVSYVCFYTLIIPTTFFLKSQHELRNVGIIALH